MFLLANRCVRVVNRAKRHDYERHQTRPGVWNMYVEVISTDLQVSDLAEELTEATLFLPALVCQIVP
jgi:hypothetical protein